MVDHHLDDVKLNGQQLANKVQLQALKQNQHQQAEFCHQLLVQTLEYQE